MIPIYNPVNIDYADVFRDFPIQDTYPIHGHACHHEVFGTFEYGKLQMAVHSGYVDKKQLRIADHPYTNLNINLAFIYEDMGVDSLELEPYPSLIDISPEEYWVQQKDHFAWYRIFNDVNDWEKLSANLLRPDSYWYKSFYTPISSVVSSSTWIETLKSSSRLYW